MKITNQVYFGGRNCDAGDSCSSFWCEQGSSGPFHLLFLLCNLTNLLQLLIHLNQEVHHLFYGYRQLGEKIGITGLYLKRKQFTPS